MRLSSVFSGMLSLALCSWLVRWVVSRNHSPLPSNFLKLRDLFMTGWDGERLDLIPALAHRCEKARLTL
jgi:hypothetical protein